MPPKKTAASQPGSNGGPAEEKTTEPSVAAAAVKAVTRRHPSTATMVREALKELDSRKGVSSQAIQSYIKLKYATVDVVRLKYLVRSALKKGIDNGTLVRPANATVTTGALGKFRLAPKAKQVKGKSENRDPNVQPDSAKDGAKKSQTAGATKKKIKEKLEATEKPKPPKNLREETAAPSKVPPAKKPKAKRAEVKESADGSSEPSKGSAKGKGAKAKKAEVKERADGSSEPSKGTAKTKGANADKPKAAKAASAPASRVTAKRVKKTE